MGSRNKAPIHHLLTTFHLCLHCSQKPCTPRAPMTQKVASCESETPRCSQIGSVRPTGPNPVFRKSGQLCLQSLGTSICPFCLQQLLVVSGVLKRMVPRHPLPLPEINSRKRSYVGCHRMSVKKLKNSSCPSLTAAGYPPTARLHIHKLLISRTVSAMLAITPSIARSNTRQIGLYKSRE